MRYCATALGRGVTVFAVALCVAALSGCGGGGSSSSLTSGPCGTVRGKVTYSGQSLPADCKITFMHQDKSFPATATISTDGSYALLIAGKPNIPVGAYKVSIAAPPAKQQAAADPSNPEAYKAFMMKGAGAKAPAQEKLPFPKKYQTAEGSGLVWTVIEGPNTFDLDMKD